MTGPETDLERIEAALAQGRASATDPRERELQELALALRADSAEPRPAFAAELDRRVAAGFPKPRRRFSLPSFWIPALAAAAVLIALAVVSISSLGGGSSDSTTSSAVAEKAVSSDLAAPAAGPSTATGATSRHVQRSV